MPIYILKINPSDKTCCYIGSFTDRESVKRHVNATENQKFYGTDRPQDHLKTWHVVEAIADNLCAEIILPSKIHNDIRHSICLKQRVVPKITPEGEAVELYPGDSIASVTVPDL